MLSDIILSLVLILVSIVWSWIGIFELGLWIPGVSADSGFIPTVFGIITLICSVIMLVQNIKKYKNKDTASAKEQPAEKKASQNTKEKILAFIRKYAAVIFCAFGILCLQYLGLVPAVFLLLFGWTKLLNKFSWVKSIAISCIVTVAIYVIFDLWLQIPFPGLI